MPQDTMSDPNPAPGRRTPPRAEPLQPDAPGRGDERQEAEAQPDAPERPPTAGRTGPEGGDGVAEQHEQALRNVREGYR